MQPQWPPGNATAFWVLSCISPAPSYELQANHTFCYLRGSPHLFRYTQTEFKATCRIYKASSYDTHLHKMESSTSCESDAELRQPIILQATRYVAEYPVIAERLAAWVHKREQRPEVAKEALTQLLHEVIRATIRQLHHIVAEFNAFAYEVKDLGYNRVDSGDLYMILQATNVAIADTLELLAFYSDEERGGHDGEFNALYARSRILDHTTSRRSDHMMMRRMGLTLGQVLQEQSNVDPFGTHVEALAAKFQYVFSPSVP